MKWVLFACLVGACSIPNVDLDGKACPCGSGYTCVRDVCVRGETDDASVDGGVDAALDSSVDAAIDAPIDAPIDVPVDAPIDVPIDTGVDAPVDAPPVTVTVIPFGSVWEYYDQVAAPPADWRDTTGGWSSGPGQLGYGDADEATLLLDEDPNVPSAYFRATFDLSRVPMDATLFLIYDDGVTVWINDTIVAQQNVTDTNHDSFTPILGDDNAMYSTFVPVMGLVAGENRIAAQVKQTSTTSSDLSFDLELVVITLP